MAELMLALGDFRFSIETAAYQGSTRKTRQKWAWTQKLGSVAAPHWIGPEADEIELSGIIYPHYKGGLDQVSSMRAPAASGEPQLLVDGLGNVLKWWVIEEVEERKSVFLSNGMPRKIEFRLKLRYYGESYASI